MEVQIYTTASELATIGDAWDRLSAQEPRFVPRFSELQHAIAIPEVKFRVLVASDDSEVVGIACFIFRKSAKHYFVADINLFKLPINEVSLFGSCVLGGLNEQVIESFLIHIISNSRFDLLYLGKIIVDSSLYNAVRKLRGRLIVGKSSRRVEVQWLIKLPETFNDYVKSLGPTTRGSAVRRFKKLERESGFEVHVISRLDQIDKFLQDAAKISRLTHQWNLGVRFCNDAVTRERLVRFAKTKTLRCYIAYFSGQPCAFGYGEWNHRVYIFRITGYDPKYSRKSPGTALMLWMIRDLIDNTDCKVFDLDVGGDFEYKTHFANTPLNCIALQVGRRYSAYSFFLIALDQGLNWIKTLIRFIVGRGKLWHWLNKKRRKMTIFH